MRVRFAPRAGNDIDEIGEYIAKRNPRAATAVVRKIRATARSLGRHPGLGRRTQRPDTRVIGVGRYPYLIYYRVGERDVTVLHIRHGRRDAPRPEDL